MSTHLSMQQLRDEYEAFAAREFKPGERVFYDGPMDPLHRWCKQIADEINAEIEAAGGLEAWKALKIPLAQAA